MDAQPAEEAADDAVRPSSPDSKLRSAEDARDAAQQELHETKIDVRKLQEQLLADRAEHVAQEQRLRISLRHSLEGTAAPPQEDLMELYGLVQAVCAQLQDAQETAGTTDAGGGLPEQVAAAERSAAAAEKLLSRMLRRPGSMSDGGRPESGEWEEMGVNPLLAGFGSEPAVGGLVTASAPPAMGRESAAFTSEEQLQNDLVVIEQLDKGAAAKVFLVQHRASQQLFALKVLSKRRMIRKKKGVAHVMKELEILSTCSHPFVVGLHASFQTEQCLCHLMEYCPRGNFYHLCQSQPDHRLSEVVSRFYAAEIISGIEYLHMHGFVYRDLKPENILVASSGHLRLTDFDLSQVAQESDGFSVDLSIARHRSGVGKERGRLSRIKSMPHVIKTGGGQKTIVVGVSQKQADKQERRREEAQMQAAAEKLKAEVAERSERESELVDVGGGGPVDGSASGGAAAGGGDAAPQKPDILPKPVPGIDRPEKRGRFNSFVGTVEYMAPEIISGVGHSYTVDFWIFGVMLYEMLYGVTAFRGADAQQTFANITSVEVQFPVLAGEGGEEEEEPEAVVVDEDDDADAIAGEGGAEEGEEGAGGEEGVVEEGSKKKGKKKKRKKLPKKKKVPPTKVSPACKDLIRNLLQKDPRRRLGYVAGAGAIKAEPFFKDVKWGLLRNQKAPMMPPEEQYQFIATGDSAGEAVGRRLPEVLKQLEEKEKAEIRKEKKAAERKKQQQQLLLQQQQQQAAQQQQGQGGGGQPGAGGGAGEVIGVDAHGVPTGAGVGMQWVLAAGGRDVSDNSDTGSPPGGDEAAKAEATAWKDFHFRPAASAAAAGADGIPKASMRPKNTLTYGSDRPSSIANDPRLDDTGGATAGGIGMALIGISGDSMGHSGDDIDGGGGTPQSGAGVYPSPKAPRGESATGHQEDSIADDAERAQFELESGIVLET
jgi:serine/threonine protein kinase/type II secretory pathway pseudopilin PulG